jgi:uncharacterized membrane protein
LEALKKLARNLKSDNNNGYVVSVLIALIFVSSVLVGYYVMLRPPQKGFIAIYLLDYQQKKALDYPELLIINHNNTFNVWVEVENHMGKNEYSEILLKVTNDTVPIFPFKADANATYTRTLENGETWETLSTVTLNKPGNFSVIFELWMYDEEVGELQFSGNACVLNVEVVNQV